MEKPPFQEVQRRLEDLSWRLGASMGEVGTHDGFPVLCLDLPGKKDGLPRVWISAGIHGEEPGGVLGCLLWLESQADLWQDTFAFTVLPCLSPSGYERWERHDLKGRDPNRIFRLKEEPLVLAVESALSAHEAPVLAVDMHEDSSFEDFYLYELVEGRPSFAEGIVDAVRPVGPIAHGLHLDPPVQDGLAREDLPARPSLKESLAAKDLWPQDYLLFGLTGHAITLETPGLRPLELRVRMQKVALDATLRMLASHLTGDPFQVDRSRR